jgi:predicted nucleic acid-binding protein
MFIHAATCPPFRIQTIEHGHSLFEEVIALHSIKKSTLGPFPRGAFEDHAAKKLILGAVAENGKLAGYLLYRRSRTKASIVHLTRHDEYDGTGVTKLLIQRVLDETKHLLGVSLHCRQDYGLKHMWSAFGFTIRASKPGRGKDGVLLDYWWYDHGHVDLFSQAAESEDYPRIIASIDANVFYDLIYEDRPNHEDTSVLQTDWLDDSLELCVTRELYAEIERCDAPEKKDKARRAASSFREFKVASDVLNEVIEKLKPGFPDLSDPREESDIKQLAHSIAAGAPFFVTRDKRMLERKEWVMELFPIEILHPTSLVNHFDVLQRDTAYRPALLEASSWQRQLLLAPELDTISSAFKHTSEKKTEFEKRAWGYLVHPETNQIILVRDQAGQPAVFYVLSKKSDGGLELPLLRHSDHPAAPTIIRHIVHDACTTMSAQRHLHTVVTDQSLSAESRGAIEKLGFIPAGSNWHKFSMNGIHTLDEAKAAISAARLPDEVISAISCLSPDKAAHLLVEQKLSPIKICSSGIQTFVVSIWKGWAEQLFSMSFDGQALLNTENRLLIGTEGVYYCSANNRHLNAPSRVLWYISQGPDGKGPMSVVACSQMEELRIGKPKEVFAKYRNLGVYSWPQVFETAGHSLTQDILAFRFVRTEKFINPVPKTTLDQLGIPQPQNPRKITEAQFASVYRLGMKF